MDKEIIAVDIDDVLALFAQGFAKFSNRRWGGSHRAEDYTEAWADFWNVSLEEAVKRSDEYHESSVISEFAHVVEAVPVLEELAKTYTLIVVTSRRKVLKPMTDAWIDTYFPGIFSAVHFAGIWDNHEQSIERRLKQSKADLCKELGASYLIDDQLKHCLGAIVAGITPLLFGNNLSHYTQPIPDAIIRVQDWEAVGEYFRAKG